MPDIPLYMEIKNYLLKLLENADGSEKIPSETWVALKFNVSRVTVRKAFHELEKKGLIKRYRGKGTFPAENGELHRKAAEFNKVAFITPNIGTHYASGIIYGAEEFFKIKNIKMSIFLSRNDGKTEGELIGECLMNYDGILLYPADFEIYSKQILQLSFKRFPVCLVDRNLRKLNLSCVSSDNYGIIQDLVKMLYERGYKHILYVPFAEDIATTNEARNKSFNDAMIKYYGAISRSNLLPGITLEREKTTALFENFLKENPQTDAVILGSNFSIVEALITALKNLNKEKDTAVAIIDDELPELIGKLGFKPYVIVQDAQRIGYEAAKTLFYNFKNPKITRINVPAKIITPEDY